MRSRALTCIVAACAIVPAVYPISAAQESQKRVLVLIATRPDAVAPPVVDATIRQILTNRFAERLDYHMEYLDVGRFPEPEYIAAVRDFLRRKYAGRSFDVVIATSDATTEFAYVYRQELFPGAAIVFSASSAPRSQSGPATTGIVTPFDLKRTIDLAIGLHPALRQVVVVNGVSEADRFYENLARDQFREYEGRLRFTYLSGAALPLLLGRLAELPSHTIIYFLTFIEDAAGSRFNPVEVLDRVAAVANAPIYSWIDLAIGHGAVGGNLHSLERASGEVANLALRVLEGEAADAIPVRHIDANVNSFDWQQLRRWGIRESLLPAERVVAFRRPSAWRQNRGYILGAVGALLLQTALIAGLLVQRFRRQRTEQALRVSYEENRDLAGRLITAQEAERARIARDLHDDLGQQLAGLAIMFSSLRRTLTTRIREQDVQATLADLQQRTSAVAETVRNLSHQLHPGVLQHAGLVATLKSLCREIERHHRIKVSVSAADDGQSLPPDVELCLYRVTQEALSNATRHARARSASVRLRYTAGGVELAISDDGIGFVVNQVGRLGLGLRSIDERVRLVRGRVKLESQPGDGTVMQVWIPLAADALLATASEASERRAAAQ